MHANCSVQIWVGCPHHSSRSRSSRQSSNIDTLHINRIVLHDLTRDARDKGGFTSIPLLVAGAKPVPTLRRVRMARLDGIGHKTGLFLGDQIYARPSGEIVGRLGASVQHNDQRER